MTMERPEELHEERRDPRYDTYERSGEDQPEARPQPGVPEGRRSEDPLEDRGSGTDEPAEPGAGAAPTAAAEPQTGEPGTTRAADEQLTVPEDRDAAAAAEGRGRPNGRPAGGPERSFEVFDHDEVEGYRRRWDTLQASFVDDPRGATQQADQLVAELLQELTRRHQELRGELTGRSERGTDGDTDGGADTERMRVALRHYRAVFQTLVR